GSVPVANQPWKPTPALHGPGDRLLVVAGLRGADPRGALRHQAPAARGPGAAPLRRGLRAPLLADLRERRPNLPSEGTAAALAVHICRGRTRAARDRKGAQVRGRAGTPDLPGQA